MSSVSGTTAKNASVFNSDPSVHGLVTAAGKAQTELKGEFAKLDNKSLTESQKQQILFNIQSLGNFIERCYTMASNFVESCHRTAMAIINKTGS